MKPLKTNRSYTLVLSLFMGINFRGYIENHSFKDTLTTSKFVDNDPINTNIIRNCSSMNV